MIETLRLGSYNAALLTGPQREGEERKAWQDRQERAHSAIDDLEQPDVLTIVELANRHASPSDLKRIHSYMGELGYIGSIGSGVRSGDRLRLSVWAKEEIFSHAGKLAIVGMGALPQVETRNKATVTAMHLDSTSNEERVRALTGIRQALDTQRGDNTITQFIDGDGNVACRKDSPATRAYAMLNHGTKYLPKVPGFKYYGGKRWQQLLSDGVRVCAMPNDETMALLTEGADGFLGAAGPGESAPTLFKGPVKIRSDHFFGRGEGLSFNEYRVHDLISGDHAAISTTATWGDMSIPETPPARELIVARAA